MAHGHSIIVESNCGSAIGFHDQLNRVAGANSVETAGEVFSETDMITKNKEPQPPEINGLNLEQILFPYPHLAAHPTQTQQVIDSGATCIAYETSTSNEGSLPLLAPMSIVAGRLSIQAGAHHLEKHQGGTGMLLGGVPGVKPTKVLVFGGGVVGESAIGIVIGMGAEVTVLDNSVVRLSELDKEYRGQLRTIFSTEESIEQCVVEADLIIGAVLIPGASAPKLITGEMLSLMKDGSVIVDVALDQGGCFETSTATTHAEPTFTFNGVTHYRVPNMPGAVAKISTITLVNAILPFIGKLADGDLKTIRGQDQNLSAELIIYEGQITHIAVESALNYPCTPSIVAIRNNNRRRLAIKFF